MKTKTKRVKPGCQQEPCSASYYGAKVAFEIPKSCEVKSPEVWRDTEIPDDLVDALFALFPGECSFETENICSPHLLIVDVRDPLTMELISDMGRRINEVLHNADVEPPRERKADDNT